MAIDLVALTSRAIATAAESGVAARATITRPAPAPDPITGVQSGSAVSQTVDVVQAEARRFGRRGDTTWAQASTALLVAAGSLTFTPQVGDTVTFAGTTLRVTVRDDYAPAGQVIAYFLGLGG